MFLFVFGFDKHAIDELNTEQRSHVMIIIMSKGSVGLSFLFFFSLQLKSSTDTKFKAPNRLLRHEMKTVTLIRDIYNDCNLKRIYIYI